MGIVSIYSKIKTDYFSEGIIKVASSALVQALGTMPGIFVGVYINILHLVICDRDNVEDNTIDNDGTRRLLSFNQLCQLLNV